MSASLKRKILNGDNNNSTTTARIDAILKLNERYEDLNNKIQSIEQQLSQIEPQQQIIHECEVKKSNFNELFEYIEKLESDMNNTKEKLEILYNRPQTTEGINETQLQTTKDEIIELIEAYMISTPRITSDDVKLKLDLIDRRLSEIEKRPKVSIRGKIETPVRESPDTNINKLIIPPKK